ncbi:DUF6252 family protein [Flavobacterium sp.]
MNKIKSITGIFLFLATFMLTSCDIEPIDPALNPDDFQNPGGGPAVFKADFSGETWNGTMSQALISENFISIGATRADGSTFSILLNATGPGTFPANNNIVAYTPAGSDFGYWSLNTQNESEDTGSITVTSINTTAKTISGTFTFKGYWSDESNTSIIPVQFTNGVFTNIPYTTNVPPVGTDSFFAKVDGVDFVEDQIDVALIEDATDPPLPNQISVSGSKNNDDSVGINVQEQLGVGTYPITGMMADTDVVFGLVVINNVLYTSESGSITIVSKTGTRMSGTFNMVCRNFTTNTTKTITNGTFDVELP